MFSLGFTWILLSNFSGTSKFAFLAALMLAHTIAPYWLRWKSLIIMIIIWSLTCCEHGWSVWQWQIHELCDPCSGGLQGICSLVRRDLPGWKSYTGVVDACAQLPFIIWAAFRDHSSLEHCNEGLQTGAETGHMEGPQGANEAAVHGWCLQSVQQFSFLLFDLLGTSPGMFRARLLLGKTDSWSRNDKSPLS